MSNKTIFDDEYVVICMVLIGILYISIEKSSMPPFMINIFKNDIFRVVFLFGLLMINFEKSPYLAIIISIVFITIIDLIDTDDFHKQLLTHKVDKQIK